MSGLTQGSRNGTISPRMRVRAVKAMNLEWQPWLAGLPVCQTLNQYQILHVGIQETAAPVRIVRAKPAMRPATKFFLAGTGGCGRVLIDGFRRVLREGFACLVPAHTLNTFEVARGAHWECCWVCYQQPMEQRPMLDPTAPVMARFDPAPLRAAILGLLFECSGAGRPTLMQQWTELIHDYVLRFAQPSNLPAKLRRLWERVAARPAEGWTLTALAREAGCNKEHLRRLCHRHLGRSPMRQVTCLRMQRAAELLATTEKTLKTIAPKVGYQSPFPFSNAFTKWSGWRPSEYRRRELNAPAATRESACAAASEKLLGARQFSHRDSFQNGVQQGSVEPAKLSPRRRNGKTSGTRRR